MYSFKHACSETLRTWPAAVYMSVCLCWSEILAILSSVRILWPLSFIHVHLFDPDPPFQTLVRCCNLFFSSLLVSIFAIANQVDWSSARPQVWQSAGLSRPPQFPNRHAELDSTINWLFIKVSCSWTSDLPRGRLSYPINCRVLLWGPAVKRMSVLTSRTVGFVCVCLGKHI